MGIGEFKVSPQLCHRFDFYLPIHSYDHDCYQLGIHYHFWWHGLDVNNDAIKLHQYKTYYKDEDKWTMYHKKYPELNGKLDVAIENIKEHYKKAKF